MAQKKLLTNGKAFKRTDDRWGGTIWYMDEKGERKRKSFSGTTKVEVTKKMTDYVAAFNEELQESDESHKTLKESMTHWPPVFNFPQWSARPTTAVNVRWSIKFFLCLERKWWVTSAPPTSRKF